MSFSIGAPEQSGLDLVLGNIGAGLGSGITEGLQGTLTAFKKQKQLTDTVDEFKSQGYPDDLARLAAVASTGGQTELLKEFLEMRKRGLGSAPSESIEEFEEVDIGLTPAEKIRRQEQRFSKQADKYADLGEKGEKFSQEQARIQRLQELNENGNLPKNLGRLNVNLKSGELIVPALASADSQEFVKIVNDFLSGAKDTFGARVTNFEVNRFLRRLPSLLNTEEGRRRVLRQMEILNQINTTYNQAVLDQFDKKGGVRNIDYDAAVRSARKEIAPQINKLKKEYVSGSTDRGQRLTVYDRKGNIKGTISAEEKDQIPEGFFVR